MQDNFAKWLFRIVAAVGAIAFIVTYSIRHDWSKGAMPMFSDDYRPPESVAPPASAAPTTSPVSTAGVPQAASVAPPQTIDGQTFMRCQPIGRTAKGELVYSMDCERPSAQ
ncbi:MAG: hypothetical protein HXX15_09795 [Rhodopseudomonas sp.]|uniref:hypothetical protein n=1 Tax=Rhodopseudomonas sp. TaxID=1078 RepID=UPI0017DB3CD3|nr:hypothetical protein [Rhodopseudomonas sp.]NVN86365.1 hypothetical protein [Rhodopseudomonas sp.]